MQAYYQHRGSTICCWMWRQRMHAFRVPGVYLSWANPVFLAFSSFNGISNLRVFNVAFSSIPTAPTKPQETEDFTCAESAIRGSVSN
jgi:hypothetical protein